MHGRCVYRYILAFANKVPVILTCPFSHARTACYRELSVWDSATFFFSPLYAPYALRARGMFHSCTLWDSATFSFFCSTICALRAPHIALAAAASPCSIHVLSRFALVLSLARDDCAAIIARAALTMCTPTPITCADCPNECLYQFGSRSVQPFGRQR
jgi:hypothetical protein